MSNATVTVPAGTTSLIVKFEMQPQAALPQTPTNPLARLIPSKVGKEHAFKAAGPHAPLAVVRVMGSRTLYGVFWSGINPPSSNNPGHRFGLKRLTESSGYRAMTKSPYEKPLWKSMSEIEVA